MRIPNILRETIGGKPSSTRFIIVGAFIVASYLSIRSIGILEDGRDIEPLVWIIGEFLTAAFGGSIGKRYADAKTVEYMVATNAQEIK